MSDIEKMIAAPEPWANKILCRYRVGHPAKHALRDGEDLVLLAEIARLRTALSEAEKRVKDASTGWAFSHGDIVRKKSGSWWEGRVVGTYSTAQTPKGYCVQLIVQKGPVQIYPETALELVALAGEVI